MCNLVIRQQFELKGGNNVLSEKKHAGGKHVENVVEEWGASYLINPIPSN